MLRERTSQLVRSVGGIIALSWMLVTSNPSQAEAQTYRETVLQSLASADGTNPFAGVLDAKGAFYTATQYGGAYGYGTVLKLTGTAATVLYNFTGGLDGANPHAGLIVDSTGNLYGTTFFGGAYGDGIVFKLSPSGTERVLHTFAAGADGSNPSGTLTRTSSGAIYGTTPYGGSDGCGVIFEIRSDGAETILHSFANSPDGCIPVTGLLSLSGGFYGLTSSGGAFGAGTVFELVGDVLNTIYSFTGRSDGSAPLDHLVSDSAGNLYGTARYGGAFGNGVVFKLDASRQETVLYSFTGGADGGQPLSGVIRDQSGNLYGTAWQGGTDGYGVAFEVSATGSEKVLYSFTGGADGGYPEAALTRDSHGNLYSKAYLGGAYGYGAFYRLTP